MRALLGEPEPRDASTPQVETQPAAPAGPAGGPGWTSPAQFAALPVNYVTATPPEQIARDLLAIRQLAAEEVVVRGNFEASTGTVEYRVITRDTIGSGLFSKITGVLTAKGLEILSANICTTTQGIVIDSFHVHDGDYAGSIPEFRLNEVESAIGDVLRGRTTVEDLFQRHQRLVRAETMLLFREPTRVVIDNDSSESFTIIDVFAHDRRGLLYTIAVALRDLGLSVALAKIATHLDQVLDVFYVTDRAGGKLQDESRLHEIRRALVSQIEEFERRGVLAHTA